MTSRPWRPARAVLCRLPLAVLILAVGALLAAAKLFLLLAGGPAVAPAPERPGARMERAATAASAPPATAPWAAAVEPAAGPEGFEREPDEAQGTGLDDRPVAASDAIAPGPAAIPDPSTFTKAEIQVLLELAERRRALDARERRLELRAELLETARLKLVERLEQLEELHALIQSTIGEHDSAEEAKIVSLVKIYETMKPKAAAEIFDQLDMSVLLRVVERMAESKASAVLARMEPARARQLTAELARREKLPSLNPE